MSDAERYDEGRDLPGIILRELPKSRVAPEERTGLAGMVVAALRGAVSAGQPLGLDAGWEGGVVSGKHAVRVSSLDLRRVTRWDRLTAFIAQPVVLMLALKDAAPDDAGTQLEMLIEGSAPLGLAPSAFGGFGRGVSAAQQPVVRSAAKIGRNDPCHCGSGKKFKKCHGA